MSAVVILDPSDSANVQFDWSDALAEGETIGAVSHTVPSPLTKVEESTDQDNARSTVKISGAVHGKRYLIEAQTTTSANQTLNRQGIVIGMNS